MGAWGEGGGRGGGGGGVKMGVLSSVLNQWQINGSFFENH